MNTLQAIHLLRQQNSCTQRTRGLTLVRTMLFFASAAARLRAPPTLSSAAVAQARSTNKDLWGPCPRSLVFSPPPPVQSKRGLEVLVFVVFPFFHGPSTTREFDERARGCMNGDFRPCLFLHSFHYPRARQRTNEDPRPRFAPSQVLVPPPNVLHFTANNNDRGPTRVRERRPSNKRTRIRSSFVFSLSSSPTTDR